MYVDNEESKTLSAIDTATLSVHHMYNLGFTPGMAMSGPQDELWITDSDSGRVVINRIDKDSVISTCQTGAGAHGIAFNADKTKAYVTNQLGNSVTVVDAQTKTALKTIQVGEKPNGICWRKN
jgi:YVTN family beta-propeller protein